MPENEVDEITRELRKLGTTAVAAVAAWQAHNPGKTKVPRRVRKEARRDLREAMRAHERHLAEQRQLQRSSVETMIADHRAHSLYLHQAAPGTPEQFTQAHWSHAQQRHHLAEQIHAAPHLTREERGQAVMALVSAHYADNPNVKQRPVWGPKPYGISALKARLAERVSRTREGLEQRRERPARTAPQPPATPDRAGWNPYWSDPATQQDQGANARLAALERQLADLADFHDREQDRWQGRVNSLGERLLESRQEHRTVAEQLAQRGQELTEAYAEIERVRGERDTLRRQAHEVRPTVQTSKAPEPAQPARAPQTPRVEQPAAAPSASTPPKVTTIEESIERLSELIKRDPDVAAYVMSEVPELAGMVADELNARQAKTGNGSPKTPSVPTTVQMVTDQHGTHRVINGDVHLPGTPESPGVIGMVVNDHAGAPHGPVIGVVIDHVGKVSVPDFPPEPPDEFEPPEMEL